MYINLPLETSTQGTSEKPSRNKVIYGTQFRNHYLHTTLVILNQWDEPP